MKKFECKECSGNCRLEIEEVGELRLRCVRHYDGIVKWHEVVDSVENEQFGKTEQLPDWVKVGAIGYDNKLNEYFKITDINNDTIIAKFIEASGYCSYKYFNEFCSEARKRPFNADEMKALVGKVAEDKDGNAFLIVEFLKEFNEEVEGFSFGVQLSNTYYSSYDLMKLYTIDSKPCYKLEHLNEKGEWVE